MIQILDYRLIGWCPFALPVKLFLLPTPYHPILTCGMYSYCT